MTKPSDSYSLRQVVELTGLSEFTLRGWENRYRAFKPRRGETGRRIYSQSDLQKAILLRELTIREYRIGSIAELSLTELRKLLETEPVGEGPVSERFRTEIEKILRQVSLQDWEDVESGIRRLARDEKPLLLLSEFFAPLVFELGRMVGRGLLSISQEHIFSSLLKERLYVSRDLAKKPHRKARFVVAAPEGDFHELGILVASAIIAHAGCRATYLGPNTPKKDLCETALRLGVSHVLIGSTVSRREGAKEDLYSYIHFIDQHLGSRVAVWLGGRNGAVPIGDLKRDVSVFTSLREFADSLQVLE